MKERLNGNPGLKRQWWEIEYVKPMDPREDCLRGGRTEPFKLHHVCGNDAEILYIDIVIFLYIQFYFIILGESLPIRDEGPRVSYLPSNNSDERDSTR